MDVRNSWAEARAARMAAKIKDDAQRAKVYKALLQSYRDIEAVNAMMADKENDEDGGNPDEQVYH